MKIRATIVRVELTRIGTDQKRYHLVLFRFGAPLAGTGRSFISPDMANFRHWKDKLIAGAVLENLILLPDGKTIDADSIPKVVELPGVQPDLL